MPPPATLSKARLAARSTADIGRIALLSMGPARLRWALRASFDRRSAVRTVAPACLLANPSRSSSAFMFATRVIGRKPWSDTKTTVVSVPLTETRRSIASSNAWNTLWSPSLIGESWVRS